MATYAKFRSDAVILNPIADPSMPNTLFVNEADGKMSTNTGSTAPISTGASYSIKKMQAGETILAGKPVSKRADGKILAADSDGLGRQQVIGVSLDSIPTDTLGDVLLFAPNAPGVLAGLGFVPGQEIFIGEATGGYVDDITPFTGGNDSIVKVGVADCAEGVASAEATDLILISQVIARP